MLFNEDEFKQKDSDLTAKERCVLAANSRLLAEQAMNINRVKFVTKVKNKKARNGRRKRHDKQVRKLTVEGYGDTIADVQWFRVELVWENKLLEQGHFELHWIGVKKFSPEQRKKYEHLRTKYNSAGTVEMQFLQSYITTYYQQNILKNPDRKLVNKAFVYKARKLNDKNIHSPILLIHLNKKDFDLQPVDKHLLAAYNGVIVHKVKV